MRLYRDYHAVFYPAIEEVNFAPYKAQTMRGGGQPLPLGEPFFREIHSRTGMPSGG